MGRADRWRDDERVRAVLGNGDPFYVAVSAPGGVHVAPVNFTRQGRRIWFFSMRRTLKVETIRRRPTVGGLVRAGDRAVMLTGRARLVDIPTGRGLSPKRLMRLPTTMVDYAVRNYKVIAGAARDRPAPTWGVLNLIPVCIDVERLALFEAGQVIAVWGDWPNQAPPTAGPLLPSQPPGAGRLPARLQPLLREPVRPAVLGWESMGGPMAIPAAWHGATGLLTTSLSAIRLVGPGGDAAVCAVVDRYGWRLKDHEGVLMAGRGRLTIDGDDVRVAIEHQRLTYWHKDERATVWRAPAPPPPAAPAGSPRPGTAPAW